MERTKTEVVRLSSDVTDEGEVWKVLDTGLRVTQW